MTPKTDIIAALNILRPKTEKLISDMGDQELTLFLESKCLEYKLALKEFEKRKVKRVTISREEFEEDKKRHYAKRAEKERAKTKPRTPQEKFIADYMNLGFTREQAEAVLAKAPKAPKGK